MGMISIKTVFIVLSIAFALYFIIIYNGLVQVKHEIDRAWANIDVILKQRFDEITKLIKTVEGYAQYEKSTLEKIIQARNLFSSAKTVDQKAESSHALSSALKGFFALSENYPELKANQSFVQLQERISSLENQLADRREYYNAAVNQFNVRIEQIPDVFVARMLNCQTQEFFKIPVAEKQDVEIQFNMK